MSLDQVNELNHKILEFEKNFKLINEDLIDQLREIIHDRTEFITTKNNILESFSLSDCAATSSIVEVIISKLANKITILKNKNRENEEESLHLKNKIKNLEADIEQGLNEGLLSNENTHLKKKNTTLEIKSQVPLKDNKEKRNMALEYSKVICRMVPVFTGETIANDVYVFINNCQMAKDCAGQMSPQQEGVFTKLLSSRLMGKAFSVLHTNPYNTVDDFLQDVKKHFLSTKTLDEMMTEIRSTMQTISEDVFSFGNRMRQLSEKTKAGIQQEFQENQLVGLNYHIDNTAMSAFKRNLFNPALKQHMLGVQEDNWIELIEEARRVESLFKQSEQVASSFNPVVPNMELKQQNELLTKLLNKLTLDATDNKSLTENQENTKGQPTNIFYSSSQNRNFKSDRPSDNGNRFIPNRNNYHRNNFNQNNYRGQSNNRDWNNNGNQKFERNQNGRRYCEWCSRLGHSEDYCRIKEQYLERKSKNSFRGQGGSTATQ